MVHLYGEGVFPRISLDLPRLSHPDSYDKLATKARENLQQEGAGKDQRPGSAVSQQGEGHGELALRVRICSHTYIHTH